MSLVQLIYTSSAVRDMTKADIEQILATSVANNTRDGLTGMLLYHDGCFMQAIEGEQEVVMATFYRIQNDTRHSHMLMIDERPITERSFSRFTMGFRRLVSADLASHPGYVPFFSRPFDPASIGARPGLALSVLETFATSMAF
jgi:hypothetical protein